MREQETVSPGRTVTLQNEALRVTVSTFGGHIEGIFHKHSERPYYWPYQSAVWQRRTSVCFPVCGALPEGEYTLDGKAYPMPMHGFLREREFTVVEQGSAYMVMECCADEQTMAIYPFSFRFRLFYRLEGAVLKVGYQVANLSRTRAMLFSVGNHYTYLLGAEGDDWVIAIEGITAARRRFAAEGYLAPGSVELAVPCRILMALIDNSTYIVQYPKGEIPLVRLYNRKRAQELTVRFAGFEYCLLWRPHEQADFVCIEPWSGMPAGRDASAELSERTSITRLEPGAVTDYAIEITVTVHSEPITG